MGTLARISGVALVPGISRNQRLYTPEIIKKAAGRMQERLADPNGLPIVMRTHHEAGDDSAKIVGRVTSVSVGEDSKLRYQADLYDTPHGKTIANLVTPEKPALRSVSIHGYWMGETKQVTYEGKPATTADDLEIDAIDFTASPGVDGALIDPGGIPVETNGVKRMAISESSEARVSINEASGYAWTQRRGIQYEGDNPALYWISEAKYSADDMKSLLSKGQAMKNASGEPSYPIADISDLKKAIRAVGRGKSSHDAIRRHIIKRARALGAMNLIPDNWNGSGANETTEVRLSEVREYYPNGPEGIAGFCIDAYAGPLSVTVRGCVDPDELAFAAHLATTAAMKAICVMDPDADGDILDADDIDDAGNVIPDGPSEDSGYMANADYGPDDDDKMGPKDEAAAVTGINRGGTKPSPDKGSKTGADEAGAVLGINRNKAVKKAVRKAVQKEMAKMMRENGMGKSKGDDGDADDESFTVQVQGSVLSNADLRNAVASEMLRYAARHSKTSPSATEKTAHPTPKESAMSDTTPAAQAAPNRTLTDEDVKALTAAFAAALQASDESKKAAAAPTQETTETPAGVATAESVTPKAEPTLAELKESLAKELRNELRAEFIKENGLPPRKGYRVSESSEEEVVLTDAEIYDKHRVDILLGQYAKTPSPDDVPAN